MRVGYSKIWAGVLIALGGLQIALAFLVWRGAQSVPSLFPAGACLLVGILYATRPYFELFGGEIVMRAVLGPAKRTYAFRDLGEVRIEDGAVWVGKQKTGVRRWLSDKADWAALERRIAESRGAQTSATG